MGVPQGISAGPAAPPRVLSPAGPSGWRPEYESAAAGTTTFTPSGYGPGGYGPPPRHPGRFGMPRPMVAPPRIRQGRLAEHLGDRLTRRPEPRLTATLAGVGVALAVLGALLWAGDYATSGPPTGVGGVDDSRKIVGIVLGFGLAALGYTLAAAAKRGPLATAGTVAGALGVPLATTFLTLDDGAGTHLVLVDAIVWTSVVTWSLAYLFAPGARGHAFLAGLGAVTIWGYAVDKVQPRLFSMDELDHLLSRGVGAHPAPALDFAPVSNACLLVGAAYLLFGIRLDATRRGGAATPFVLTGTLALAAGVWAAVPRLHELGAGIVAIVLGTVVALAAAHARRRFTTWFGGAAVGAGVIAIVEWALPSNAAGAGAVLIAAGVVVVGLAALASHLMHEPDDMLVGRWARARHL